MTTMTGSPRQAAWATEIRAQVVAEARAAGRDDLATVAATVADGKWWIERARLADVGELASALGVGLTGLAARVHEVLMAAGIDRLTVTVAASGEGVMITYTRAYWRLNAAGLKVHDLGGQVWDALTAAGLTPAISDRQRAVDVWIGESRMVVRGEGSGS